MDPFTILAIGAGVGGLLGGLAGLGKTKSKKREAEAIQKEIQRRQEMLLKDAWERTGLDKLTPEYASQMYESLFPQISTSDMTSRAVRQMEGLMEGARGRLRGLKGEALGDISALYGTAFERIPPEYERAAEDVAGLYEGVLGRVSALYDVATQRGRGEYQEALGGVAQLWASAMEGVRPEYERALEDVAQVYRDVEERTTGLAERQVARQLDEMGVGGFGMAPLLRAEAVEKAVLPVLTERARAQRELIGERARTLAELIGKGTQAQTVLTGEMARMLTELASESARAGTGVLSESARAQAGLIGERARTLADIISESARAGAGMLGQIYGADIGLIRMLPEMAGELISRAGLLEEQTKLGMLRDVLGFQLQLPLAKADIATRLYTQAAHLPIPPPTPGFWDYLASIGTGLFGGAGMGALAGGMLGGVA